MRYIHTINLIFLYTNLCLVILHYLTCFFVIYSQLFQYFVKLCSSLVLSLNFG